MQKLPLLLPFLHQRKLAVVSFSSCCRDSHCVMVVVVVVVQE
jgi:hypothetical protein